MATVKDYKWKYEGKNPIEKLREGEPYFFLRAQDKLSVDAIRAYSDALHEEALKCEDEAKQAELMKQAIAVMGIASSFFDWQQDHPEFVKLPD